MTKFKKLAIAVAVASAAMMPMASNATVVIDGVAFNAGDQLITTALWESQLGSVTDTLSGVGIVSRISCTGCGGSTWVDTQNNTQLSYYFTDFKVAQWYDFGGGVHSGTDNTNFSTAKSIDFTGGTVQLFTDRYSTGTVLDPAANPNVVDAGLMSADIANAIDGNLWLSYAGAVTTDTSGRIATLFADTLGLNSVHSGGSGFGYLDVLGGAAASNFNTNSYNIGGTITDARLDSSFSTSNSGAWPLSGTAAIKTNAIPEPGSLALLGLGLIGLAATYRRKSSKKA